MPREKIVQKQPDFHNAQMLHQQCAYTKRFCKSISSKLSKLLSFCTYSFTFRLKVCLRKHFTGLHQTEYSTSSESKARKKPRMVRNMTLLAASTRPQAPPSITVVNCTEGLGVVFVAGVLVVVLIILIFSRSRISSMPAVCSLNSESILKHYKQVPQRNPQNLVLFVDLCAFLGGKIWFERFALCKILIL